MTATLETTVTKMVDGIECVAKVGGYIKLDERADPNLLLPGFDYADESFVGSQFSIHGIHTPAIPLNIRITGRTLQERRTKVRIEVEFVHDSEPSTFCGGWLYLYT